MATTDNSDLILSQDTEAIQAFLLAEAINGNALIRGQMPSILSAFEEPYRTVASLVSKKLLAGEFIDRHTLGSALELRRLTRCGANGMLEHLTAMQVVNLIFASDAVQPGQVEAYLQTLQARQQVKKRAELREKAVELAKAHGDQLEVLASEIEQMLVTARQDVIGGPAEQRSELLELLPYVKRLGDRQKGTEFLGLDSGFAHVNSICNGLDTGLVILGAPPGGGKTSLVWQMGCQAAEINRVPVIFISLEQSKDELRAKALARLSKLQYRHILRGRFRSDDPQDWPKLLDAAKKYSTFARYLTIVEGDNTTTVNEIDHLATMQMAKTGASRCLILVDYLQLLPLHLDDAKRVTNTKDRVDLHVSALRRIARKLNSPVIAISAENRAGYDSARLNVFKESGGIEYSADVAMVLKRNKQQDSGPGAEYKALDLKIIKNRNGETGVVKIKFYASRAEFVETGKEALAEETED